MLDHMSKEISRKIIIGSVIAIISGSVIGALVYFSFQKENLPLAVEEAMNYITGVRKGEGETVSLISWEKGNGFYKLNFKIGEREYQSFVSEDGKYLFPYAIDLIPEIAKKESQISLSQIEKRDRPDVKLFVMSYCPYGLQIEKAYLSIYALLKEKADFGIYFVDYIMHGKKELEENLRQYCIQKEEKEKYSNYLSCFIKEGSYEKENIFERCLAKAKIDEEKLENCLLETDREYKISTLYQDKSSWLNGRYPKFNVQSDLNEKYGVKGSPTLVINDSVIVQNRQYCPQENIKCVVVSDFDRSPEKFKEVICQSFLDFPVECTQTLSKEVFSPGFGLNRL